MIPRKEFEEVYFATDNAKKAVILTEDKVKQLEEQKKSLEEAHSKVKQRTIQGMSLKEQLDQCIKEGKQFEIIKKAVESQYHNTVCDKKCRVICHYKCGLKFTTESAALIDCEINGGEDNEGKCYNCGCPFLEHSHVKVDYEEVKVESMQYKDLKERIFKMEELGLSQSQIVTLQENQIKKLDNELVLLQKEVDQAL